MTSLLIATALSTAHAAPESAPDTIEISRDATDIGNRFKTGIGVHVGTPAGITGKLFTGEHQGIVANLEYDPLFSGMMGARAGYEFRVARLGEWHWGVVDLNGEAVAAVQGRPGGGELPGAFRAGAGGGLTASVLLKETPLEIYSELQLLAYPLALAGGTYWTGGIVGMNGGMGVRYYF